MFGLLSTLAVAAGLSGSPSGTASAQTSGAGSEVGGHHGTPVASQPLAWVSFGGKGSFTAPRPPALPRDHDAGASHPSDPNANNDSTGTTPSTSAGTTPATPAGTTPGGSTGGTAAVSGTGGAGATSPASGNSGDCHISITDLLAPVSVTCTTGSSGDVAGTGTGGNSGPVSITGASGTGAGIAPTAAGPVGSGVPAGSTVGGPGAALAIAAQGQQGICETSSANSGSVKLAVDCVPGTVGSVSAQAVGGQSGQAIVPIDTGGAVPSGPPSGVAGSGDGGTASTLVSTGNSGNCIIRLTNIAAAVTVICVTGNSGTAAGASTGGASGSSQLVLGPNGSSGPGGSGPAANTGMGGSALAIIGSGNTGNCIVYLVNVRARVTVLCITGNSGAASGTAVGGPSGGATVLAASFPAAGTSRPASSASGTGGTATTLVSSGNTGLCGLNLTNTEGHISLLCHTGSSGSAAGSSTGGDSGSAMVLLSPPSPAVTPQAPLSPFTAQLAARSPAAVRSSQRGALATSAPAALATSASAAVRSSAPAAVRSSAPARAGQVVLATLDAVRTELRVPATLRGTAQPASGDGMAMASGATYPFTPFGGLGTTVPMSLAAGMLLAGGARAAESGRRKGRLR